MERRARARSSRERAVPKMNLTPVPKTVTRFLASTWPEFPRDLPVVAHGRAGAFREGVLWAHTLASTEHSYSSVAWTEILPRQRGVAFGCTPFVLNLQLLRS